METTNKEQRKDPFSQWFQPSRYNHNERNNEDMDIDKNESNIEPNELPNTNQPESNQTTQHQDWLFGRTRQQRFNSSEAPRTNAQNRQRDWLFGRPRLNYNEKHEEATNTTIDINQIMETASLFQDTVKELKPLWDMASPYIDNLKKSIKK